MRKLHSYYATALVILSASFLMATILGCSNANEQAARREAALKPMVSSSIIEEKIVKDARWTIYAIERPSSIKGLGEPKGQYLVVRFNLENLSNKPQQPVDMDIVLPDGEEVKSVSIGDEESYGTPIEWGEGVDKIELCPNQTMRGFAVFDAPLGLTKGIKLKVEGWGILHTEEDFVSLDQEPSEMKPKTEEDLVSDLARKNMNNVTSFSFIEGCGVEGAPTGAKTVNVIAETGSKSSFISVAGSFMEQVFAQFADVYYIQMKGLREGYPSVQFAVCRTDVEQLSKADWSSNYLKYARDYWDEDQ
jgi:hypothetical protein